MSLCYFAQEDGAAFDERSVYVGPVVELEVLKAFLDEQVSRLTPSDVNLPESCSIRRKPQAFVRGLGNRMQVVLCCPDHSEACIARLLVPF